MTEHVKERGIERLPGGNGELKMKGFTQLGMKHMEVGPNCIWNWNIAC